MLYSMLKRSLFIIFISPLVIVLMISCSTDKRSFEMKGKLSNITGDCFYASISQAGKEIKVDTIKINNKGEFSYRGQIDTLSVMSLFFNNNDKYTYILVDKGLKIELKGDVMYPDLIDVSGGKVNDDLTSFKHANKELLKSRADLLSVELDSVADKGGRYEGSAELKNINFQLSNIAAEYIKNNPEKVASVILIDCFFKNEYSLDRLIENLNLLRGEAETFPLTYSIREYSEKIKLSSVGAFAPYFILSDYKTHRQVSLTDFKNKYVLLSFVSTKCQACDEELTDAVNIYNRLKKGEKAKPNNQKIEFVTIVINGETKPISKSIIESVKWSILQDNDSWASKTFNLYNINEIPYNILISPQGVILERDIAITSLPEKLSELSKN